MVTRQVMQDDSDRSAENEMTSYPEGGEKAVRERLEKTHVEEPTPTVTPAESTGDASAAANDRGRPRRKRSFEELELDNEPQNDADAVAKHKHVRKRSKSNNNPVSTDLAPSSDSEHTKPLANTAGASASSPRNSKNNEAPDDPSTSSPTSLDDKHAIGSANDTASSVLDADPKLASKTPVEQAEAGLEKSGEESTPKSNGEHAGTTTIPKSSGFSNASAQSPFAGLNSGKSLFGSSASGPGNGTASSKDTAKRTDQSAFPSFASLAGSAASPFATAGSSIKAATAGESSTEQAKPSGFGALANQNSVFGSGLAKTFGGSSTISSPFGGSGTRLTNFSSGKGTFGVSGGSGKPLSSTSPNIAEEEEDGSEPDEAQDNTSSAPETVLDKPQDLETGEEDETTIFQYRAKLYISHDKQWKERCTGNFKVNKRNLGVAGEENSTKISSRFIMRSDASHKVLLNSPITKEVNIEDPAKGRPTGRQAVFLGFMDGTPKMMLVKMKTDEQIQELVEIVSEIQSQM